MLSRRPTIAYIDGAALSANFAAVRARLAPAVRLLAVVKADGYGHGALLVAPILARAGTDFFGVATVDEGVELREGGIHQPILVLTGADGGEVDALCEHRLSAAVISCDMIRSLRERVGERRLSVHVKLDTGMGRLGVRPEGVVELIELLRATPQLHVEGVFSHFADADDASGEVTNEQLKTFHHGLETMRAAGIKPAWVHLANSVAALTRPDTHFDMVRPGIALYGIAPEKTAGDLAPVMHLHTKIWQLKSMPAGTALSYGHTYVTRRQSRIAVLPIGYADGYDRSLSNRAEVQLHGKRAPVVGRVCMDLTLIDVTDIPMASVGDDVLLWGGERGSTLSVGEVAGWQDSIPYEVLTRVGKRVPRVLL